MHSQVWIVDRNLNRSIPLLEVAEFAVCDLLRCNSELEPEVGPPRCRSSAVLYSWGWWQIGGRRWTALRVAWPGWWRDWLPKHVRKQLHNTRCDVSAHFQSLRQWSFTHSAVNLRPPVSHQTQQYHTAEDLQRGGSASGSTSEVSRETKNSSRARWGIDLFTCLSTIQTCECIFIILLYSVQHY